MVGSSQVSATPFTTTVPATGVALPDEYPEAGGVAIVLTGANGNIYYQYSDPDGAFRGFNFNGQPTRFRGNPFTINDPINLDCGFRDCIDYFGGSIARIDIRFSAYDGDTQVGGFDEGEITLRINNFDVGGWSGIDTERTDTNGTRSFGMEDGFGNNTFNTGWFSSTNQALLNNILSENRTVTQVFDNSPNDNYWDFRRGPRLANDDLRTIAPGYEFEKTLVSGPSPFAAVGDVLTYDFEVRNIGSVRISDIEVVDDKIPNVTCPNPPANALEPVPRGTQAPNALTCRGTYTVTQEDVDAGEVTNIARASGTPEFGQLGQVEGTVTVLGPTLNNAVTLTKVGTPDPFGAAGTDVTYTFTIANTGNTTLTNVVVTDPKLLGLSCTIPSISPLSVDNTTNTASCSGQYRVTQLDVDAFAINGATLDNMATVTATGPDSATVSNTATDMLAGQPANPGIVLEKTALQASYAAVGDEITYRFLARNTGNVTWPGPPTITDAITGAPTCPAGPVAPGASVTCEATLSILQGNLDDTEVENTATAVITVAGETASSTSSVTVPAVLTPGLEIEKRLAAGSPNPFDTINQTLIYEYVVTNTGNATVENLSINDDRVAASCGITTIAPGDAPVVCTSAAYTIDQSDLNLGSVTNIASVAGTTLAGSAVTSDDTDLTVPADQDPAILFTKSAPPIDPFDFDADLFVTYTYTVQNTGNVTLTDPIVVNDDKFPNPIACAPGPLLPGATETCTAVYDVTPADVLNGFVTNQATATDGDTVSNAASVTVPQMGNPAVTIEKTADTADFTAAADSLDYTFTVRNTGSVNIVRENGGTPVSPITINDNQIAPADITCNQPLVLFPEGSGNAPTSYTCTGTVDPVGQAAVDAGAFTNTASAQFDYVDPTGMVPPRTVNSAPSSATVTSSIVPDFTFTKSTTDTFGVVGDVLSYTLSVTNLTNQTLTNVSVSDPLVPGYSCTLTNVGPMANASCPNPVEYSVIQDDLDRGEVLNRATAIATTPTGATLTRSDTETVPFTPATPAQLLTFAKTALPTSFTTPGTEIVYTLSATNAGLVTLRNVIVEDPVLGLSCTIPTLAPGVTDSSCEGSRLTTQDDIDAGGFTNTASARATGVPAIPASATVTGPARVADYVFTKTASNDFTAVGDRVTFTLTLQNTGNVTLNNVALLDTFFDPDLSCNVASIAPGVTDTSCSQSYTVDQDDINAGAITNMGSFTSDGVLGGPTLADTATAVSNGPTRAPSIDVTKVERNANGAFASGVTENYDFSVSNTGNVTLRNVVLNDALTGYNCAIGVLEPGATVTSCPAGGVLETSLLPDQDDVDLGVIENTVTVSGDPDGLATVNDSATVSLLGPDQLPALTLAKTVNTGADFTAVGDVITYFYDVTNTGNVTLTAPITIADDRTSVTCPALPAAGLAPGGPALRCTASYTVDQADLDLGSVTNVASASISQPVVPSATYPDGTANVSSPVETAVAAADQMPELSIEKRIKAGSPTTFSGVGDLSDPTNPNNITFEFVVTNSGNVTITDDIEVTDTLVPVSNFVCGTAPVAPGGTVICEAVWPADQISIDNGAFTNSATAATTFGTNPVVTPTPGMATAFAAQRPELTLTKDFTSIENNLFADGNDVTYTYTVANTGNTTITDPVTVNDNLIGPISCGTADLLPGESRTCVGIYEVSADDFALGVVTNVASVTDGTTTSVPVTETIPQDVEPAITLLKEVVTPTGNVSATTDVITYRYTITNTSPASGVQPALGPVFTIADDKIGSFTCDTGTALTAAPQAGSSFSCTETYNVMQEDLDAVAAGLTGGFVTNTATAQTTFRGQPVLSNVGEATVLADAMPALTVAKLAENLTTPGQPANIENEIGDTLRFTITVTNDGNQTMSNIMVDDPMLTGLACTVNGASPANLVIEPGEAAICTGTYVVVQDDIDAGIVTNTAMASGANPQGALTQSAGGTTYPVEAANPGLTVTKTLIPNGGLTDYTAVDETLRFRITVLNSGNVTYNDINVTDSKVAGTCSVGTLAPLESDESCEFEYTVLQADVDAGTFENTATATGTPATPGGMPQSFDGLATSTGPLREPAIAVDKSGTGPLADGTFDTDGQQLTYTFTVANLGNVTLTRTPVLVDDVIGTITDCDPLPAAGLLPTETLECRANYPVDQDDVDAGFVTNMVTVTMPNEYDPTGPDLVATDSQTINAGRAPAMTVTKVASSDANVLVDDDITYTYTVTNTGNVRLSNITLTDAHTSAAGVSNLVISNGGVITLLEPGASATLTATYTVLQGDIDAGAPLTNTVTATATPPTGLDPLEDTADEEVSLDDKDSGITVVKTVPNPPAVLAVGTNITFNITVANTGNVTLTIPTLVDTLTTVNDLGKPAENLTPVLQSGNSVDPAAFNVDEVFVYEVIYALTQDDIDAGGVSNTVTASANDPQGDPVNDVSDNGAGDGDDPTVVPVTPSGGLVVLKTLRTAAPDPAAPLDEVIFQISVANTGNVSLTAPVLVDTLSRTGGDLITPAPTATFENGDADNDSALDVGETWIYNVTYALTQDDIDAGGLSNTVTATANDPSGTPVSDVSDNGGGVGDDPTLVTLNPNPGVEVVKTVTSTLPAVPQPNDIVSFEIAVENTGNVTLDAPVLSDTLSPIGGAAISPAPVPVLVPASDTDGDGSLSVGETWRYTLDYPLTQTDIDAGGVTNTATATTRDPSGTPIDDQSNNAPGPGDTPTTATLNQVPGLEAIKSILNTPQVAGDLVLFEITLENTGNVTLSAVDVASDTLTRADTTALTLASGPDFVAADRGSASGTLRAGETATYRASYVLQQEDIDAGGISNTATGTGTPPGGGLPITDVSDNGTGDGDDPTDLPFTPAPALEMTKRLIAGGPTFDSTDDVLTFAFDVTNTGNVTIPAPITIDDPVLVAGGGSVVCPPGDLLPDGMITCEGSFTVSQAQIDAGSVTNTATAVSTLATSPPSSVTVLAQQLPALETDKEAVSVTVDGTTFPGVPDAQFRVGAIVTYNYTVTNIGNTTITAPITVTDNLIDPVICPALVGGTLTPTQSLVCEATFEVTADDVALGSVTNLASASDGTTVSDIVSETVPAGGTPALETQKSLISAATAGGDDIPSLNYSAVGDVLTYEFTVTNTGEVSFVAPVTVIDDRIAGPIACFTPSASDPDLFQGESITCEATYTITQDDLDEGDVTNTAFSQTIFGAGAREVVSAPVMETATADATPGFALSKTAATLPATAVDQVLTYTLVAQNTGNQTLRQVVVRDPLLAGFRCEATTLAPGAALTCDGDYTVLQSDIDRGTLLNTASANAVTPRGAGIDDTAALSLDMPASAPGLTIAKSASIEPFGPAGSTIQYRFAVTNTGNTTLTDILVTDAIVSPGFTCDIPSLAPGVTDTTCLLGYTVTQADVDRGSITNTADVMAVDPFGTPIADDDTINTAGMVAAPSLIATKRASVVGDGSAGSLINFTITATNNGNVTLSNVAIEDTFSRADGTVLALDGPVTFVSGDGNGDGRLNLSEVWTYSASYTLTQDDVDAGGVSNVVVATGDSPTGSGVLDTADDGDDSDGNTEDDPTVVSVAAEPEITVTKSVATTATIAGDTVTFDVIVLNTGNVTVSGLVLTDTMTNADGTDVSAAVVGPTRIGPDDPIPPLGSAVYEVSYDLTQADIDSGGLSNSVTAAGTGPGDTPVSDVSDSGDPADGNGESDPTILTIEALPSATLAKEAGAPVRLTGNLFDIPFTVTATNTGNVTLSDLTLSDDLAAFAAPATVVSVTAPIVSGLTVGAANSGFNGVSDTDLVTDDATLAPSASATATFTVRLDIGAGAPAQPNVVMLGSDRLAEDVAGSAEIAPLVVPEIVVTKSVTPSRALVGATVTYTIQVDNEGGFDETGLTVVDDMPAGLRFVPGSARVNGSETPELTVRGRRMSWTPLALNGGESLTVTLQARVTEGPGSFENRAFVLGRDGALISNVGTAVLEVPPEAVFDCGDVIGRVFDDRNLNGYQDGIPPVDRSAITDQTFDGGKFTSPPVDPPSAEKGLPGVRLATVDGTIITTDEYGRYSVPCAALPADIGSNFTLKLDTTSLPTGYRVTSENPRNMRLTPGTVTRMNFGAGLADVIDVALTNAAFASGQPSDALKSGIRQLVGQLSGGPSVLRLQYLTNGESQDVARARLNAVEALIREAWPRNGRFGLVVERTIAEVQ